MTEVFKQSKAGPIPKDWNAVQLKSIGKVRNGINKPKEDFGSGFPFVNLMDVFGVSSIGASTDLELLETTFDERRAYDLRQGDVLFVRSSVKPSGVGLATLIEEDLEDTVFSGFLLRFRDDGSIADGFKKYCFAGQRFREELIASSTVSANTNINQSALGNLWLALPPSNAEQQAIAEALSDADALIEGLERLIAKKRLIKQGAMQDLLTAKRRLPGFSGEWIETSVGAVITRNFCGPSPTCEERNVSGDEWGVLKTTAITFERGWDWRKHKTLPKSYWGNRKALIEVGDVIVTKAGPRHRVGVPASVDYIPENILVSGKMIGLRPDQSKTTPLMLASAIAAKRSQVFLDQRTTGMAESQVNFNNDDLLNTPISLPVIEEQRAITNVAADFDAEIQALETRLEKARQVKEGMMQNLLTGRIRLV